MYLTGQELLYVGSQRNLKKKVVTELEEVQDILHQYHTNPMGGHSGINNTLSKISNFYVWNGMKEDVEYEKKATISLLDVYIEYMLIVD